jgi:Zn-dependent protease with chaperone function
MMLNYFLRLVCLCFAAFFLVHTAVGMLVVLTTGTAVRAVRGMPSRRAERLLFILRLLPLALAIFMVLGVCVPSYLWLETEVSGEEVGALCLVAAILACAQFAFSLTRGLRAAARTRRHARVWELAAQVSQLPGVAAPVWILDTRPPVLALAGVFHSQVVISRPVIQTLTSQQLAAALRHEEAHRRSHDNLKRLCLMLSPTLVPGMNAFTPLERAWARFSEWAADDEAVAGSPESSLSLAAALVRVARLGGKLSPPPLTAAFLGDTAELSERVDRLLSPPVPASVPRRNPLAVSCAAALCLAALCLLNPASLASAHRLLENLIH